MNEISDGVFSNNAEAESKTYECLNCGRNSQSLEDCCGNKMIEKIRALALPFEPFDFLKLPSQSY